jgi:hypothetical protein
VHVTLRIDHVYIEVPDPDGVWASLAKLLHLGVAWPVQDYGDFRSGGLALGAFNLELVRFAGTEPRPDPRRLDGIALAGSSLESAVSALRAQELRIGDPVPFGPPGPVLWTNAQVDGLLPSSTSVFVCAYEAFMRDALERVAEQPAPAAAVELAVAPETVERWRALGLSATAGQHGPQSRVVVEFSGSDEDRRAAQAYVHDMQLPIFVADQETPRAG